MEPCGKLSSYASYALVRSNEHPEPVERYNVVAVRSARLDKSRPINLPRLTFNSLLVQNHFPNQSTKLVYDAVRFAQAFNDPIADHPLSVYYSALPFVPIHSTLFQTFHDRNLFPVVVAGFEMSWSPLLRVISGYPDSVAAFSRDGTQVACGSFKKCLDIRVLDLASGLDVLSPLQAESNGITSLTFSHDGSRIASGDCEGIITMWDALSGHKIFQLHAAHKCVVYLVEFSPDGQHFVSRTSNDGHRFSTPSPTDSDSLFPHFSELQLWDTSSGIELLHLNTASPLAFSPDGAQFVLVHGINIIDIYNTSSGQSLAKPLPLDNINHEFDTNDVVQVVWTPDSLNIIIGSNHLGIIVWNAESQTKIQGLELAQGLTSLAVSHDGSHIAYGVGNHSCLIYICDFPLGQEFSPVLQLVGHQSTIQSLSFSPDSTKLFSAATDSTIRIWDMTVVGSQNKQCNFITSIAFSPDGTHIASGSDGEMCVWDAHLGIQVLKLDCQHFGDYMHFVDIAFSPDGKHLTSLTRCDGNHHMVTMWNRLSGEALFTVQMSKEFAVTSSIIFCPDGKVIAVGMSNGICTLDALSGEETSALQIGHNDEVTCLAFSSDGTRILSGCNNQTIHMWDVLLATVVLSLSPAYPCAATSVSFSPSNKRIVSLSPFGLCSWDAISGTCLSVTNFKFRMGLLVEPCIHSRIGIATEGTYIIDFATGRTMSRLPPAVYLSDGFNSQLPAFAEHEGVIAASTPCGQFMIMHFPPAVLASSDTQPYTEPNFVKNNEEIEDLFPIEIFHKFVGQKEGSDGICT